MKKIMALLCTVAMSVGLLAGCGSSSGDNQSVSGSDNTGDGGKVVMLACEPEVPAEKEAWEEVAADFEKETGYRQDSYYVTGGKGVWRGTGFLYHYPSYTAKCSRSSLYRA